SQISRAHGRHRKNGNRVRSARRPDATPESPGKDVPRRNAGSVRASRGRSAISLAMLDRSWRVRDIKTKGRRDDAAPFKKNMRAGHSGCGAPDPHTYMQANRNSHTTSTKCQYHAANWKPRCCFGVKWPANARSRQTLRKIEPMITCAP